MEILNQNTSLIQPVDKYNMLVKVAEEKDEKLKAEIQEISKNLKKAVEKNDEKARQELTEWQGLLFNSRC